MSPPIEIEDDDGRPVNLESGGWHSDLVLCGGERIEIQLRGRYRPTHFNGSVYYAKTLLERHPANVIVTGKITKNGRQATNYLNIEDAKICRQGRMRLEPERAPEDL